MSETQNETDLPTILAAMTAAGITIYHQFHLKLFWHKNHFEWQHDRNDRYLKNNHVHTEDARAHILSALLVWCVENGVILTIMPDGDCKFQNPKRAKEWGIRPTILAAAFAALKAQEASA